MDRIIHIKKKLINAIFKLFRSISLKKKEQKIYLKTI